MGNLQDFISTLPEEEQLIAKHILFCKAGSGLLSRIPSRVEDIKDEKILILC